MDLSGMKAASSQEIEVAKEKSDSLACPEPSSVDQMASNHEWINGLMKGLTAKSISDKVSHGDFTEIEKLMGTWFFQSEGTKLDFIEGMENFMMSSTSERTKRTLIHWAALHNNPLVLDWILFKSAGTKFCYPASFVNAQDVYGYTALHLAAEANHVEVVRVLLKHSDVDVTIAAANMRACERNKSKSNGLTPLHFAARNGSFSVVKMLLESQLEDIVYRAISAKSTSLKTVLHYAAEGGNWQAFRYLLELLNMNGMGEFVNQCDVFRHTPLYLASLNENVEILEILLREGQRLNINTVAWDGMTALDVAKRNENLRKENMHEAMKGMDSSRREDYHQLMEEVKLKHQRIVEMLESYDVHWLQAERQKYANAANCLLVGSALIESVTYVGWMQPPLGLTQYYNLPASTPGTFESYVGVEQHSEIQMFWFFNSLSFFSSVATFIIGADAGIPDKCSSLREEVVQLRNSVVRASFILSMAILFVIGAFASAGILVLPPIQRQRAPMYVTVAIGLALCLFLLTKFIKKLKRWFLSPSLQYKREASRPLGDCPHVGFTNGDNQQNDSSTGNDKLRPDDHKSIPSQHSDHRPLEDQYHDNLLLLQRYFGEPRKMNVKLQGSSPTGNVTHGDNLQNLGIMKPLYDGSNPPALGFSDDHQKVSTQVPQRIHEPPVHRPGEEQRGRGSAQGPQRIHEPPVHRRGEEQRRRSPARLGPQRIHEPPVHRPGEEQRGRGSAQGPQRIHEPPVHRPLEEQWRTGSRESCQEQRQKVLRAPARGSYQLENLDSWDSDSP